jgi:glycosyltransferase involved in cell wall biosynthesis
MNKPTPTGFSIVLCTFNGQVRLQPTLSHISALEIPFGYEVELILVDNASTDNTSQFASEVWDSKGAPFPLILLKEPRAGKGYAVETGYDAASYSHILTVDDDNWLASNYLIVAQQLLAQHPDVGVLQGKCTAVFEALPPPWFKTFEYNFVIGSPIEQPGYFPRDNFHVWGAGMVIEQAAWLQLRKAGFSFLTSKLPGKAAGEDTETAMALMLSGRKVYYSDELQYQHFMPASRANWEKLKMNYKVYAYARYYFFLYALIIDAHNKNYKLSTSIVRKAFLKGWLKGMRNYTMKQHLAYWVMPREEYYQARLAYYHAIFSTFSSVSKYVMHDIIYLETWILPALKDNPEHFEWTLEI